MSSAKHTIDASLFITEQDVRVDLDAIVRNGLPTFGGLAGDDQ